MEHLSGSARIRTTLQHLHPAIFPSLQLHNHKSQVGCVITEASSSQLFGCEVPRLLKPTHLSPSSSHQKYHKIMRLRKTRNAAAAVSLAGVWGAVVASAASPLDLYEGPFTSQPRKDDLLHAIHTCDHSVTCAGISLASNGTVESHTIYEHSFVGPLATSKTHVSAKPYTFHRGRITAGKIVAADVTGLTLREAKEMCTAHDDCVGFTYPLWSMTDLNHLPNVTLFSTLEGFAPDEGLDEYRSYVSNDAQRTALTVDANLLSYDEKLTQRPYSGCCKKTEVPTMEEVKKADTVMPRISCNISREEFFLKYEVPRKPVMLVGCDEEWPARTEWTYDKLAPRFANESKWRARLGGKSESYSKIKWEVLADAMRENKPFYVFDQLMHPEGKNVELDYVDPAPMRGGNLYAEMNSRGIMWAGPLRWFCIGRFGSGTKSHIDPFSSDAWNSLIKGHKWWIIYPEGVTDRETFCQGSCSNDEILTREWYGSIGVNAARTEYPNDKYAYHVLQRPGETIYVPDGIVHSVFNLDATIAVTRNYGSAANLDKVWEEACTSGDDRKWKIMYNLVLNKEQRRRVRDSKYYPFHQNCKEIDIKGSKRDKALKGKNKPKEEMVETLWHPSFDPKIGDTVEARYNGKHNEWYKGRITKVGENGLYNVKYDDDDSDKGLKRISIRRYIPLKKGEIVKSKVIDKNGRDVWTLSVIKKVNDDGTVNVKHFDGEKLESLPAGIFVQRFDWRYQKGNRVMAKWKDHGWFKALVAKVNSDGTYDIDFDDGDFRSSVDKSEIKFTWV